MVIYIEHQIDYIDIASSEIRERLQLKKEVSDFLLNAAHKIFLTHHL